MPLQAPVRPAGPIGHAVRSSGHGRTPARQPHRGIALALILVASFMVVLDFSIVNVALPAIERELGLTVASVQWVVTGYAITFGGFLILGGRAADLFGRRRMFIAGLTIFALASLAGGLAADPVLLVASRFVQGAGAALVAPAALSLITTGFAEGNERTRALGLYGATASIGFVAGQVFGGLLVQYTTWHSVFLVNVPIGLLAAALAPVLLPSGGERRSARRLDIGGAVTITAAVAALVYAVSQAPARGWTSLVVLSALAAAAVAGAAFVLVERRHADPLLRPGLLRLPSLRSAGTASLLMGAWSAGEMLVLSLYFQQVLRVSPLMTGLAIAPQGVVGFVAAAYGSRMTRRIGVRGVLMLTSVIAVIGFAILTQLPATGGYSALLLAVTLVGFGTSGVAFGTVVLASGGIPDSDQGVVGGIVSTSRQVGAAIGAALLPAIAEAVSHVSGSAGVGGDRAAMLAGAVGASLAVVVAVRAPRTGQPVRVAVVTE